MSLREKITVGLLTAVFFALFYSATRINYYSAALDSAYMMELVDTTFENLRPRTYLTKTMLFAVWNMMWKTPQEICSSSLTPETPEWMNAFEKHSFLVLYLMAPFRFVFTTESIVFFVNAVTFVGFLLLVYLAVRRGGAPIGASLAFVFFASAHPAWSYSAYGQFYPDRYFLPLGLIYILLLRERLLGGADRPATLLGVALLAATTTERSALVIGIVTLAALALYRGRSKWRREDLFLGGISAALIAYTAAYMALFLFQKNPDYPHYQGEVFSFFSRVIQDEHYRDLIFKFLIVNVLFFGIAGALEWRLSLIGALAMAPNVLGSHGTAEKNNYWTHYHSLYYPLLVAAALVSFVKLWNRYGKSRLRFLVISAPVALGVMLMFLDPLSTMPQFAFKLSNAREYAVLKTLEFQTGTGAAAFAVSESKLRREAAASVPDNSEITTPEPFTPALYRKGRIHYYPLGLDSSQYAVLRYTRDASGKMRYEGAMSYLGREAEIALDDCLNKKLLAAGYSPQRLYPSDGPHGIAILKRNGSISSLPSR